MSFQTHCRIGHVGALDPRMLMIQIACSKKCLLPRGGRTPCLVQSSEPTELDVWLSSTANMLRFKFRSSRR